MEVAGVSWTLIAAGVVGLLIGIGLGMLLGRRSGHHAARVRRLTEDLEASRQELSRYRGQVGDHFTRTSDLLRRMTLQYRAVYDHLAEGARTLSPDGAAALAAGMLEAPLPLEAGEQQGPSGEPALEPLETDPEPEDLEQDQEEDPALATKELFEEERARRR